MIDERVGLFSEFIEIEFRTVRSAKNEPVKEGDCIFARRIPFAHDVLAAVLFQTAYIPLLSAQLQWQADKRCLQGCA